MTREEFEKLLDYPMTKHEAILRALLFYHGHREEHEGTVTYAMDFHTPNRQEPGPSRDWDLKVSETPAGIAVAYLISPTPVHSKSKVLV